MDFMLMDGIRTYNDIANFFAAKGWGCKQCGKLHSSSWWQCSGDTYCWTCKKLMNMELRGLVWHEYPQVDGDRGMQFDYDEASAGFDYAAWQRQEFERIFG